MRRQSHEAGDSWRKWSDPLMYGAESDQQSWPRRVAFWLFSLDVGLWAALIVRATR